MSNADKLLADLSSWYWWFTAVAVALIINLLSAYAKPWLDNWLDRRSLQLRALKTRRRQEFEDKVEPLASDSYLLLMERLTELRDRVQLIYFVIGCILMFGLAVYFSRATDINAPFRYVLVGFAAGSGLFAYLFFFRLLMRSNESARRYEAALKKLRGQGEG